MVKPRLWVPATQEGIMGDACFRTQKLSIYSPPEVQLELHCIFSHATYWCLVYLPTVFYRKPHIQGAFMNSVQTDFWTDSRGQLRKQRSLARCLKRWLIIIADNFSQGPKPHKEGEKQHKGVQGRKCSSVLMQISREKGRKTNQTTPNISRDVMRANLCSLLLLQSHRQRGYDCT